MGERLGGSEQEGLGRRDAAERVNDALWGERPAADREAEPALLADPLPPDRAAAAAPPHVVGAHATGDIVGEGIGGASGAVVGAILGSIGGQIGAIIGALAGAAGGWWAGRTVSHVAAGYTPAVDDYYREHFAYTSDVVGSARTATDVGDRIEYERVRPAYQLGYVAANNPDYQGRPFEDVEPDLRDAYAIGGEPVAWEEVRGYAQAGYERAPAAAEAAAPRPIDADAAAAPRPLDVEIPRDVSTDTAAAGPVTTGGPAAAHDLPIPRTAGDQPPPPADPGLGDLRRS